MDNVDEAHPDRIIEGEGTSERAWRAWPGLAALPEATLSELVPPGRRVVIVAPHPDDELLGTGGLMATLIERARAAQGAVTADIVVVAVTDGTGSHPNSPLWPVQRLAQVRPAETDAALRRLLLDAAPTTAVPSFAAASTSATSTSTTANADATTANAVSLLPRVIRARFSDGHVTAHEPALRSMLQTILQADDVVFCTWRLDGHPDHEAVGRAAAQAAAHAGATLIEVPIWTWHWAQPGDPRVPWRRARRLLLSKAITHAKREAAQAYPSQLTVDPSTGAAPILPPFVLERVLRDFEVFFVPLDPQQKESTP